MMVWFRMFFIWHCVSAASPLIRLLIFRKSGELFHKANSFQRLFLMVHKCMYGHTFLRKLIKRVLELCLSLPSFFYTCKSTLKARCNQMWWLISRTGTPCKLVIQFTVHWNIHSHCRLKCCYFGHEETRSMLWVWVLYHWATTSGQPAALTICTV